MTIESYSRPAAAAWFGTRPYHVGVVVDDLEAAIDEYARMFDVSFIPVTRVPMKVLAGEKICEVPLEATYSREEGFHLEVIQAIPGSIWTPGRGWHHIGFWSDDVAHDSAMLSAAGYPAAVTHVPDDGQSPWFAYHLGFQGAYIELVSKPTLQPVLETLWRST